MKRYLFAILLLCGVAVADVYRVRIPGVTDWFRVELEKVEPQPMPAPAPKFIPPSASVTLTIDGKPHTAELPAKPTDDLWLDGPLVKEWRSVVAPGDHSFLRVIFDTRVYADGTYRLDVAVENCQHAAGSLVTYDVSVKIDGEEKFAKQGVKQDYLTRWRQTFGHRPFVPSSLDQLVAAKAVPRFDSAAPAEPLKLTSVLPPASYDILNRGNIVYTAMGATGGRPDIAIYPAWAARTLVHRTPELIDQTLVNGDLGGSWPVHVRNDDGSLISLDKHPNYWIDARGADKPQGDLSTKPALIPDTAHTPSLAYVPYLLTGDRYYADEMAFWANYGLLASWFGPRNGTDGLVIGQVRQTAWTVRNMADAAAWLPDTHPLKPIFARVTENNLRHFAGFQTNDLLFPFWDTSYGLRALGNYKGIAPWEYHYVAVAFEQAKRQGFDAKAAEAVIRPIVAATLSLYTDPDFDRNYAAAYQLPLIRKGTPDVPFTSLAQVLVALKEITNNAAPTYYYTNWIWPLLGYAEERGLAGVKEAKAFIATKYPYSAILADSGWAIVPDGPAPESLPTYEASGEWVTLPVVLSPGQAKEIAADGLPSQADVKCRWPDGSVKFALLTVRGAKGEVSIREDLH